MTDPMESLLAELRQYQAIGSQPGRKAELKAKLTEYFAFHGTAHKAEGFELEIYCDAHFIELYPAIGSLFSEGKIAYVRGEWSEKHSGYKSLYQWMDWRSP